MDKLIELDTKVNLILTDEPYGTTACKWDSVIPFDKMWERLHKLSNIDTPTILFGSQPFTSELIHSNLKEFKCELIWQKSRASNFMQSKRQPLKYHENIEIFYNKQPTYNPIMVKGNKNHNSKDSKAKNNILGIDEIIYKINTSDMHFPSSVINIKSTDSTKNFHPTQKPVELMEYLISTYTNERDVVLDFTMGSGTTGVACKKLNRKFIGIELDNTYFKIAQDRINSDIN